MASKFYHKIPFTDPAQVGYISYLEGTVERQRIWLRNLRAKQNEMIIAMNALTDTVNGYVKKQSIAETIRTGQKIVFKAKRIEPLGEGIDG
jgi:hypothetical protein